MSTRQDVEDEDHALKWAALARDLYSEEHGQSRQVDDKDLGRPSRKERSSPKATEDSRREDNAKFLLKIKVGTESTGYNAS